MIPFPTIAAKAITGPSTPDEENAEQSAERALEEKLRQLLAQKTAGERSLKPESTAPSHLVTALEEIALQQSLLRPLETRDSGRNETQKSQESQLETFEAKEAQATDVSLAPAADVEVPEEDAVKIPFPSLVRMRLDAADELAPFIESENRRTETREVPDAVEAAPAIRAEAELKPAESRQADASQEMTKAPATSEPLEVGISEPAPVAAFDMEAPGKTIALKKEEFRTPELRVAEVFEEKREGKAPPDSVEQSVPKANAIVAPQAEIAHAEFAPEEAKPDQSAANSPQAFDATLKEIARAESSHSVSEAAAATNLDVEIPQTEVPSEVAESKKPEVHAAELFEATVKGAPQAAFPKGIVSDAESIFPPETEIAQTESVLKEAHPRKAEQAAEADEVALEEIAKPGMSAALPVALPRADTASREVESNKPEESAAEVSRARRRSWRRSRF